MTLKYFNVKNGLTTGNIILNAGNSNISAGTFIGNINATGIANLGSIANVKITGGAANYVISTDGTGNLTWAAQSGGGGGSGAYNPVLDTFTGTGSQTEFTLSVTPATIYNTIVNIDGVSQLHDAYSLVGATITFDSAPSNGAAIEVLILATTDAGGTPSGSNTQVQFNNDGNFGGSSGLTFDSTTTTLTSNNIVVSTSANLGSVSNVIITGGTTGQYLQTDGAGNLSWSTVVSGSTSTISNGNSNVNIVTANGNITMSVDGTNNIVVVANTGITVTGVINSSGNITASRIISNVAQGTSPFIVTSTTQVANLNAATAGTVRTGAQPNITSVGTLSNLVVSNNISATFVSGGNLVLSSGSLAANGIVQSPYKIQAPMLPTYTGSGSTTLLSNNVATGGSPVIGSVDPTGRFFYVVNSSGSTVSMYTISNTGVLSSIGAAVSAGSMPYSIVTDPTGRFAYTVNLSSDTISQFLINQTTGALTAITTAIGVSDGPYDITVDPTGRYVYTISYAGGGSNGTVSGFSINQTTGALTALSPATISIPGGSGYGITVDPTGRFVYVAAGSFIGMFSINQSNGTLTSISTAISASAFGYGLVCDPSGRFLYFYGTNSTIEMYSINQLTGALTSLGSPVATGAGTSSYTKQLTVDPTGMYLYAVGSSDHSLTTFSINQQSGVITKVGSSMTGLNNGPSSASITPNGRFIVIPLATSNVVSVSSIDNFQSFRITANIATINSANFTATTGTAPFIVNSTTQVANLNSATAGRVTTASQPNITSVGTLANLTSNGTINFTNASNVSLGAVGNVKITGGTANYVLSTDGTGNLSWVEQSGGGGGSSIANGTSNVNIATANGNITASVAGNANIATITGTGVNIAGTLNVTGVSNLGPQSNVIITGGSNGYMLTTDGSGTLSWSAQPTSTSTTDAFIGNGVATSFTLSVTPASIDWTVVNYNGVIVLRSDYTLTGNVIEFANAPANLAKIEVTTVTLSAGGGGGSSTAATVGYALVFGG